MCVTSFRAKLTVTYGITRDHVWGRHPDFHLGNTSSCRSVLLFILTATCSVHDVVPVPLHSWSINQRISIAWVRYIIRLNQRNSIKNTRMVRLCPAPDKWSA